MNRALRMSSALAVASLLLCGCTQGKRPFEIVQMCVQNTEGVNQLRDELKAIAATKEMKFIDNSAGTKRDLQNVGYPGRERADGSPVINMAVLREDGMGVGAGNLGLPGYQVALGFSEGSNPSEARRFAGDVIKQLEGHWHVDTVPSGSGAMPKPGCR
jgi:hypothetical protein